MYTGRYDNLLIARDFNTGEKETVLDEFLTKMTLYC